LLGEWISEEKKRDGGRKKNCNQVRGGRGPKILLEGKFPWRDQSGELKEERKKKGKKKRWVEAQPIGGESRGVEKGQEKIKEEGRRNLRKKKRDISNNTTRK